MTNASGKKRTDWASRVIKAPPRTIYRALLDPAALVSWLPPEGMKGHIDAFDGREGGTYRMALTYDEPDHATPGKTSDTPISSRGGSWSWCRTSGSSNWSNSCPRNLRSRAP
jgi:hypothetical protein